MSVMNRCGEEAARKRREQIADDMARFTGEIQQIPRGLSAYRVEPEAQIPFGRPLDMANSNPEQDRDPERDRAIAKRAGQAAGAARKNRSNDQKVAFGGSLRLPNSGEPR